MYAPGGKAKKRESIAILVSSHRKTTCINLIRQHGLMQIENRLEMTGQLAEWWEVMISTLAGFATGFFAEPVKIYFSNRSERARLRIALYREMVHMYLGFNQLLQFMDEGKIPIDKLQVNLDNVKRFDLYTYAKSTAVITRFYELKESIHIDTIYKNFQLPYNPSLVTAKERAHYLNLAISVFNDKAAKDEISASLLREIGWEPRELQKET